MPHDRPSRRRHLRAVPPLLRLAAIQQRQGSSVRGGGRRAADRAADAREGRDAHRCRDRSRHRVVPQRALERLQDGRGHRARAMRSIPSAGERARRDGRRRVADGRARSGRRARVGREDCAEDERVEKVCIWTVDKDLAQCVRDDRVVQMDRRANKIFDAQGVRQKFGVEPALIPDFLALVGDAADGYPGVPGIGAATAARLLNRHGPIEALPPEALGAERDRALLFKRLATLRTDAPLFRDVEALRWSGPTDRLCGMGAAYGRATSRRAQPWRPEVPRRIEGSLSGRRHAATAGPRAASIASWSRPLPCLPRTSRRPRHSGSDWRPATQRWPRWRPCPRQPWRHRSSSGLAVASRPSWTEATPAVADLSVSASRIRQERYGYENDCEDGLIHLIPLDIGRSREQSRHARSLPPGAATECRIKESTSVGQRRVAARRARHGVSCGRLGQSQSCDLRFGTQARAAPRANVAFPAGPG